jgi:hypothetical protein
LHFGKVGQKVGQAQALSFDRPAKTVKTIVNKGYYPDLPVWRNGRRTGLKIFKIALSDHFLRLLLTRVSAFVYRPIFNFSLISPHPLNGWLSDPQSGTKSGTEKSTDSQDLVPVESVFWGRTHRTSFSVFLFLELRRTGLCICEVFALKCATLISSSAA